MMESAREGQGEDGHMIRESARCEGEVKVRVRASRGQGEEK